MAPTQVDNSRLGRARARQLEILFLQAVRGRVGRLQQISPRPDASPWKTSLCRRVEAELDHAVEVKRLLAERGLFDRHVLEEMPLDRAVVVEFTRRLPMGRMRGVRVVAVVVNPLEELVETGWATGPVPLTLLQRRIEELLTNDGTFTYIGVFSPTGFEPAAQQIASAGTNYELYLVVRRPDGRWEVRGRGPMRQLFDPEETADKIQRCLDFIHRHRGRVILGGLTVRALAEAEGVEEELAERALGVAAERDPHFVLRRIEGEVCLVYTDQPVPSTAGPLPGDSSRKDRRRKEMGLIERLIGLFRLLRGRRQPDHHQMLRQFEEHRARLEMQREEFHRTLEDLEREQRQLGEELRGETSRTRQENLARKIAGVRRRIGQVQRRLNLCQNKIDILSTHINNLTIALEDRTVPLPSEEEMKSIAVEVDSLVEGVEERADLAWGLDSTAAGTTSPPEVEEILAEFGKGERAPSVSAEEKPQRAPEGTPQGGRTPPQAEPPPPDQTPASPPPVAD